MSVVPFVLTGSNTTVVQTQGDYEKAGGLDGQVILIQNLDQSQIRDTDSSNASYDLRIGDEYRDHRDSGKTDLVDGGKIHLQPGAAVIVETAEYVQFPKARFGHIVPKVSLLQSGLSNTSSKVDPGYRGKLAITVFNLGKRTVSLTKGQTFCTLYVLDVQAGVTPYNKPPRGIQGGGAGVLHKMRDFIEANQALLTCLSLIASLVVVSIQISQSVTEQRNRGNSSEVIKTP